MRLFRVLMRRSFRRTFTLGGKGRRHHDASDE
jgi:hypothetical protein